MSDPWNASFGVYWSLTLSSIWYKVLMAMKQESILLERLSLWTYNYYLSELGLITITPTITDMNYAIAFDWSMMDFSLIYVKRKAVNSNGREFGFWSRVKCLESRVLKNKNKCEGP